MPIQKLGQAMLKSIDASLNDWVIFHQQQLENSTLGYPSLTTVGRMMEPEKVFVGPGQAARRIQNSSRRLWTESEAPLSVPRGKGKAHGTNSI
jgi:hypothetical protein